MDSCNTSSFLNKLGLQLDISRWRINNLIEHVQQSVEGSRGVSIKNNKQILILIIILNNSIMLDKIESDLAENNTTFTYNKSRSITYVFELVSERCVNKICYYSIDCICYTYADYAPLYT